jgi:hypothetical protein
MGPLDSTCTKPNLGEEIQRLGVGPAGGGASQRGGESAGGGRGGAGSGGGGGRGGLRGFRDAREEVFLDVAVHKLKLKAKA